MSSIIINPYVFGGGGPPTGTGSAQRIWLRHEADGAPAVTPAYSGGWDSTAEADRAQASFTFPASGNSARFILNTLSGSSEQFILFRQWVSPPIVAQEIASRTIKGQIGVGSGALATVAIHVYIVSNDGSTVRGVLLNMQASASTSNPPRWNGGNSVQENRSIRDSADNLNMPISSVTAQDGDRLAVELGAREVDGTAGNFLRMRVTSNGLDLGENDTETAANNTWIELSNGVVLQ